MRQSTVLLRGGMDAEDNDTTTTGTYPATAIPDQNQLRAMIDPIAQNGTTDWVNRAHFNMAVETRTARIEALRASGAMLPKESSISEQVLATRKRVSVCSPSPRIFPRPLVSFRISRLR